MPLGHCSVPRCSGYATHAGQCATHAQQSEQSRGSSSERGYSGKLWRGRRRALFRRDPFCRCDADDHGHEPLKCMRVSTVADHHPDERKDLVSQGVRDPDALDRLRGMCASCHSRKPRAAKRIDRY